MNLTPRWVQFFEQHGWHAVHWRTIGEPRDADRTIMDWAREHGYMDAHRPFQPHRQVDSLRKLIEREAF